MVSPNRPNSLGFQCGHARISYFCSQTPIKMFQFHKQFRLNLSICIDYLGQVLGGCVEGERFCIQEFSRFGNRHFVYTPF